MGAHCGRARPIVDALIEGRTAASPEAVTPASMSLLVLEARDAATQQAPTPSPGLAHAATSATRVRRRHANDHLAAIGPRAVRGVPPLGRDVLGTDAPCVTILAT